MSKNFNFLPFQFSISTLLLLTVIAALAISNYWPASDEAQYDESFLDSADKAVLKQLRIDGLDIEHFYHKGGMGSGARFAIVETSEDEFHVTYIYVRDTDPCKYLDEIVKFPELNYVDISNFRSLSLKIMHPGQHSLNTMKETVKRFLKLQVEMNRP